METLETLLNPKKSQLLVILREHVLICGSSFAGDEQHLGATSVCMQRPCRVQRTLQRVPAVGFTPWSLCAAASDKPEVQNSACNEVQSPFESVTFNFSDTGWHYL